jgi:hypothetical protein
LYQELNLCYVCSTRSVVHSYLRTKKLHKTVPHSVNCIYWSSLFRKSCYFYIYNYAYHDMRMNCASWKHWTPSCKLVVQWRIQRVSIVMPKD